MPPATTRTALSAAAPASASAMASLASRFGRLQMAGRRAAVTSGPASSARPSSSLSSSCCRRQGGPRLASSAMQQPLASPPAPRPAGPAAAAFSTTSPRDSRLKREQMRKWLREKASVNYDAARLLPENSSPNEAREIRRRHRLFPGNPTYKKQSVLSDGMRTLVWTRVRKQGESIKAVAASLGIDMRRVAAVVRLKELEYDFVAKGKKTADAYSDMVLHMLSTHSVRRAEEGAPFENINEIDTHSYTKQQLFVPVSESRQFTREDAARAFHDTMLPADKRMPIPELIQVEKDIQSKELWPEEAAAKFRAKAVQQQQSLADRDRAKAESEEQRTTRVETDRFQFRIRDINSENVGRTGRSTTAVGCRYGAPYLDRKRGQAKIPTSVG